MRALPAMLCCLVLAGWNCTLQAGDELPQSTNCPADAGTIHGSILLTIPDKIPDSAAQKVFDTLRSKKYNAKIRRYVVHDSVLASGIELVGSTYDVPFEPEIESSFVICAPAGTYSVVRISSTSLFEKYSLCLQSPASLEMYSGKNTYVGRMTIAVGLLPYEAIDMPKLVRKTMEMGPGPKGMLTATVSVVEQEEAKGADTRLMTVREKQPLNSCEKAPVVQPPAK